jgi:CRP-like cAMP-binding protein
VARNSKVEELKQLPAFSGLSARQLQAMASNLDEVTVRKGEAFMTEGRTNQTFWIILDGEASLTVAGKAKETAARGDLLGVPSMFSGREAMADVVAKTDLRALVASHAQFNSLLADSELAIRFKAAIFDRLRDELYQLTHKPKPKKK